jgi:hypothetical protein
VTIYYQRAAIRRAVGRAMHECFVGLFNAPGLTFTTLTVPDLIDPDESPDRYKGNWFYWCDTGGLTPQVGVEDPLGIIRRVIDYDPLTGVLTFNYPITISGLILGTDFELHSLISPRDLNDCINQALLRCTYLYEAEITPVLGQRTYHLPSDPGTTDIVYLRQETQIVDVLIRTGDTATGTLRPMRPFRTRQFSQQGIWLDVPSDAAGVSPSDSVFVVRMILPHEPVDSDLDDMNVIAEWVEAGARMLAYKFLAETGPAEDTTRYKNRQLEAAQVFGQYIAAYAPRDVRPIMKLDNF